MRNSLFCLNGISSGLIKFKEWFLCVEVNRPERRAVQQVNQLVEHFNKPPVTLLNYKCIYSPSFHSKRHFTKGLASAATVEEIRGIL